MILIVALLVVTIILFHFPSTALLPDFGSNDILEYIIVRSPLRLIFAHDFNPQDGQTLQVRVGWDGLPENHVQVCQHTHGPCQVTSTTRLKTKS